MITRKDINALTQAEIDTYIHALNILRDRSRADPDDPTGYDFQARLHNDIEVGPCEHGNDLFLAWHRCHLHYFEQLLRDADRPRTANIALPYWDWSRPDPAGGRYPAAFSLAGLVGDRFANGDPLPSDTLKIVLEKRDWNEFGGWPKGTLGKNYGAFELGPHNYTHSTYIGGLMGNPETASEDPIYWSFHCFIDLLWAEWQRRNPTQPATSPKSKLRGFSPQPLNRVEDFQDLAKLGYGYEYNDALAKDLSQPSPAPVDGEVVRVDSLRAMFTGTLQDRFRSEASAEFLLPRMESPAKRILIVIDELNVPTLASFTLHVYVHPRAAPFAEQSEYYAGYVSMWKAHDHGGHGHEEHGHGHGHGDGEHALHPASAFARLDATEVILPLLERGEEDLVATFRFAPAPLPSGETAPLVQLVRQVELRDLTLEVIR